MGRPILRCFSTPPPSPTKADAPPPMGHPPSEKHPPPPLKHETPFHEMILEKAQ